jgi:uncharacterized protein HemX
MSQMNPENSYSAALEASRQFAKKQLELANAQAAQDITIAAQGRQIDGLKQQINDLHAVVASLSSRPPHRWRWWIFNF